MDTATAAGSGLHDRLARFRVSATDANSADASSEQPLITQRDEAANHNGGQLLFGPDGYLSVSIGDEGAGDDSLQNSQRIDKDFFSTILRLDVDRRRGSLPPNLDISHSPLMRRHTVFEDLSRGRSRLERPGYWQNRCGFACSPHFLHIHDSTPPVRSGTAEKTAESVKYAG